MHVPSVHGNYKDGPPIFAGRVARQRYKPNLPATRLREHTGHLFLGCGGGLYLFFRERCLANGTHLPIFLNRGGR